MEQTTASRACRTCGWVLALWLLTAFGPSGCDNGWLFGRSSGPPAEGSLEVPEPMDLLLPRSIRIHPFTGARAFDEAGGVKGIDVRIEARDAFGDPNKAFGKFRFELYQFRPNNPDPKGKLLAHWEEDLLDPKKNLEHWSIHFQRTYDFRLLWDQPIPVGARFVLRAIFSSPFTQRLYDERVFVSGQ